MIFTKGAHHSVKFQTFDCSGEIHQICTLIGYFCWKCKVSAQKSMEEICLIIPKSGAKFEEKLIFVSKMTRIWWILIPALKSLKNCTLIGPFCTKYAMFDLKKYRGVIFHDTEEPCKIWIKSDLWFGKWHEEFGKFSSEPLESFKKGILMGSFCPK